MRAVHNSRLAVYRSPFGAVTVGSAVSLAVDVWEAPDVTCVLRLWVDGEGETLLPMEQSEAGDCVRFSCRIEKTKADLLWYSFRLISPDGAVRYLGAAKGRTGGEGQLYDEEPPSFQITVYEPRALPEWYRGAIVYQIFPDRYRRGGDWRQLAEQELAKPHNGTPRRAVDDWEKPVAYERTPDNRVAVWDFYGGTLSGITESLDRLRDLGFTAIYLNPIFEAASNHRYDTGDYTKIDGLLGDEEAFRTLAREAGSRGISLILDGVFNHTGCDSLYFNRYGNYPTTGAYQSPDSPYRSWYRFDDSAIGYDCWWGIDDLPALEEDDPGVRELVCGENGVIRKWLRAGARGWRLDVADELPDDFIREIKSAAVETLGDDALVIGEVWEDASNKISYGKLRRYFLGGELDSVMNYPLRDGALGFLRGETSAEELCETIETLRENYPPTALFGALNLMGSHDRMRVLTALGEAPDPDALTEEQRRCYRLSPAQRMLAKARLRLLLLLQMTMPGVPCVYYGDEAGLEGYSDPYNRATSPWGHEDADILGLYRAAIELRQSRRLFTDGDVLPFSCGDDVIAYYRFGADGCCAVLLNRSLTDAREVSFPMRGKGARELLHELPVAVENETVKLTLPALGAAIVEFDQYEQRS